VDGVILAPPLGEIQQLISAPAAANLSAVAVAVSRPLEEMSVVSIDDHQAALEM
jgi:LacI family transcriptional regulator